MYPSLGQARPRFEGGPRQQRNPRVQQQRFNNNNSAAKRVLKAEKMQRTQEIKEAYITAKLDLTQEQKDKFLPVFKQFQSEMYNAQMEQKQIRLNPLPNGQDQADREDAVAQKLIDIRKHYRGEFLKVIPSEKVYLIPKYEQEFNIEALQQLKDKRGDSPN